MSDLLPCPLVMVPAFCLCLSLVPASFENTINHYLDALHTFEPMRCKSLGVVKFENRSGFFFVCL